MSEAPIVLVQGPESAQSLLQQHGTMKVRRWIVCNAYSGGMFIEKGIPFVDENFYFDNGMKQINEINVFAHRLSTEWFKDISMDYPNDCGVRPEMLCARSFNYYFLTVLNAFYFLERIHQKEGSCRLLTTRFATQEGRENFFLPNSESIIPTLLDNLNERWNFNCSYSYIQQENNHSVERFPWLSSFIIKMLASITHVFCRDKILLSGNPLLLMPVARELKLKSGVSSLRIKEISRMRQIASLAKRYSLFMPSLSCYKRKNFGFNESEIWDTFCEKKTFCFKGIDFLPILWNKIRMFLRWEAQRIVEMSREINRVLDRVRPEYVIVDEDVIPFNRALVIAAKKKDIKTLVVSHGLPGARFGFVPLQSDNIAVWGENMKSIFLRWGIGSDKIIVTGCPKYDRLNLSTGIPQEKKDSFCKEFKWSTEKPIALIVTGGLHREYLARFAGNGSTSSEILRTADYFLRIAKKVTNVNFVFKVTPGLQSDDFFQRLANKYDGLSSNIQLVKSGLAVNLINISDVVFNSCSSASLEAIILKKPVVNMNFSFHPDVLPFAAHGLGASVRTYEEALKLCQDLGDGLLPLEDWVAFQENLVSPFVFSRDGKSSERIASFISRNL
jgi:hypothetical protein